MEPVALESDEFFNNLCIVKKQLPNGRWQVTIDFPNTPYGRKRVWGAFKDILKPAPDVPKKPRGGPCKSKP